MRFARLFAALTALCLVPAFAAADKLPPPGETREYKGVRLIGTAYPDRKSDEFFRMAQQAVDMIRTLPDADWNRTGLIGTIIYDPPSPHRELEGSSRHVSISYIIIDRMDWPGPVVVPKSTKYISALDMALALVAAGIASYDHKRFVSVTRRLEAIDAGRETASAEWLSKARRAHEILTMLLSNTAPKALQLRLDCRNYAAALKALKVLSPSSERVHAMTAELNERGCL